MVFSSHFRASRQARLVNKTLVGVALSLCVIALSLSLHVVQAVEPYWGEMFPINKDYISDGFDQEMPTVAFNTNPSHINAVVVWSSKGSQTQHSSLVARRLPDSSNSWHWYLENDDPGSFEVTLYTAPDLTKRTFESSIACDQVLTWVVAFTDGSDIKFVYSSDNALTWSAAQSLHPTAVGSMALEPQVLFDARNQMWYATWISESSEGGTGNDLDVALSRSSDGAATWSSPTWVNPFATTDTEEDETNVRIVYGRDSANASIPCIHVLYHSTHPHGVLGAGTEGDIFITTSCNAGVTFGPPRVINPSAMANNTNAEAETTFDAASNAAGENVVVVYRTTFNEVDVEIHQVRATQSHDGGYVFDIPTVIHTLKGESEADTPPSVRTDSRGLFICAFASRQDMSRTADSDYFEDDTVERMISTQSDVDIFYSIAGTEPLGIPGTGWSIPHVPSQNDAVFENSDTNRPVLVHDGAERWAMIVTSNQRFLSRWADRDTGTDYDIHFMDFTYFSREIWYRNGIGLTSYSPEALQKKVNSLPTNVAEEIPLIVGLRWFFGGNSVQEAMNRSVVISNGRRIKLVRSSPRTEVSFHMWGNHLCYYPFFVVTDATSGVTFDKFDQGFYDVDSTYLVRNEGNSPLLFFQKDDNHGYHRCDSGQTVHFSCPLGYRPPEPADGPTYFPKYCVPCPEGRDCGDSLTFMNSSSPSQICPAGRYCPRGTFNSKFTKCDVLRVYTSGDTGMQSRDECRTKGTPCEFGFWCAPGTLQDEYVQVLENDTMAFTREQLNNGIVLDETLVYPSDKTISLSLFRTLRTLRSVTLPIEPFNEYACHVPIDACNPWGVNHCLSYEGWCGGGDYACNLNFASATTTGEGCQRSIQIDWSHQFLPSWLDVSFPDTAGLEKPGDLLVWPLDNVNGAVEIYSQAPGVSISDRVSHPLSIRFIAQWDTYPYRQDVMVPLRMNITRSVTTVIFNPADKIDVKARFDATNFTSNATMFNIGCDDSLGWTAVTWDCSSPLVAGLNPLDLDVNLYPVDWIQVIPQFSSGFIGIGVTDPAIIAMRVSPQRANTTRAVPVLGLSTYRACLRVQFVMTSDPSTVLKKDLDINLATFQECSRGTYSELGTSENGPCTPCEAGSYSDTPGATTCKACPESFPRSAVGATSVAQCKAAPGYFRDADNTSLSCSSLGPGVSCLSEGLTLATIQLLPGYWRSDARSKHILRCPNRAYCVGGVHRSALLANTSSASLPAQRRRLAVNETDESYCLPHHRGPYCQVCEPGYVKRGMAPCAFCDATAYAADQQRLGWTILAAAIIVVIAFLLTQRQRFKMFARRRAESLVALGKKINARGSIVNNLRMLDDPAPAGATPVDAEPRAAASSSDESPAGRPTSKEAPRKGIESLRNSTAGRSTREFARSVSRRFRPISQKIDKRATFLWSIIVSIEASTTLRILVSLFQVIGGISKNFNEVYPEIFQSIANAFNALSAEIFYNIDFACVVHTNHYLSLILGLVSPLVVSFFKNIFSGRRRLEHRN